MLRNLSTRDLACLMLRVSLGVIFIVHGCAKIQHEMGTSWEREFPAWMNAALAWGELVGGIALVLGVFTRVIAGAFAITMCCALYVVGTVKGFTGIPDTVIKTFDYLRVGAEFPFALLFQCGALLLLGGGALSVDHYLLPRLRRGKEVKGEAKGFGEPHVDVAPAPAPTSPR
jgi:uncharacterized membrane protein YphA (DoxX/SURF4 family)